MRKVLIAVLALAVPAVAADLSWSENFNSYPGGTTDWGASAAANGWILPTVATKLDGYIPSGGSGQSPRMGNTQNTARCDLGGVCGPTDCQAGGGVGFKVLAEQGGQQAG